MTQAIATNRTLEEIDYMIPRNTLLFKDGFVKKCLDFSEAARCGCRVLECQACNDDWYSQQVLKVEFEEAMSSMTEESKQQYIQEVWLELEKTGYIERIKKETKKTVSDMLSKGFDSSSLEEDKAKVLSLMSEIDTNTIKNHVSYFETDEDGDEYRWHGRNDSSQILLEVIPRTIIEITESKMSVEAEIFQDATMEGIRFLLRFMNNSINYR